jgi:hypothetical protein
MRIGKTIWHAKRIVEKNSTVAKYETPTKLVLRPNYLMVMPATSGNYLQILQSGENIYNMWNATANGRVFSDWFKAGDVVWLDGESPIDDIENEYGNGASATAEIKSAVENNLFISMVFERRQDQITK